MSRTCSTFVIRPVFNPCSHAKLSKSKATASTAIRQVPQSKHYAPVKNAEDAWPPGSLASTIGVVAGVSQFCNVLARLFSSSNFSIRESLAKALTPKRPRKAVRSMQARLMSLTGRILVRKVRWFSISYGRCGFTELTRSRP